MRISYIKKTTKQTAEAVHRIPHRPPCCSVRAANRAAPHRWWRSPPCFHQGLGAGGELFFPQQNPPKKYVQRLDSMIPWFGFHDSMIWIPWFQKYVNFGFHFFPFHFFPRFHISVGETFSNKYQISLKKVANPPLPPIFRKLPASQVTKCHSTYISWVTRMWPEILVCLPQRRLGDFDQFLAAKMGRILWNPIKNHDFKAQRSISGGFLAKSPLILLRCEISCEWSWSWVFDPEEVTETSPKRHRKSTKNPGAPNKSQKLLGRSGLQTQAFGPAVPWKYQVSSGESRGAPPLKQAALWAVRF